MYEQDIRRGLQSIRRIIKDHNITGVHGPLAELLECEEKFFTALEVTAGNRYILISATRQYFRKGVFGAI